MKKYDFPFLLIILLICFGTIRWIKLERSRKTCPARESVQKMLPVKPVLPREHIRPKTNPVPLRTLPELAAEHRLEFREGDMSGGSGSILLHGPIRHVEAFVYRLGTPECGFSPEALRFTPAEKGCLFCSVRFGPKGEVFSGPEPEPVQRRGTVPVLRRISSITDAPDVPEPPEPEESVTGRRRIGTVIREGGVGYAVIRTTDPGGVILIRDGKGGEKK